MERSSRQQIKFGAIVSYLALGINIAATLLYTPWTVAAIGKANYAMYTLANSFVNIFVMDFGLSSSVSKFVAQYRAENNKEKEDALIATVVKIYLVLDVVIFVVLCILFFFIDSIYTGLTPAEIKTFRELYLIVASYAVVSFPFMPLSGIMYAYETLMELKLCELFQKVFSICLVIIALAYRADVRFVVLSNVISALLTIAVKLIIIKKKTCIHVQISLANKDMFKQVTGFTIWVAVQALAMRCIFSLAPSILGIVATSDDIAVFSPASAIEGYFASVAAAINGFFVMRVTKYIVADEKHKLYQLMLRVGRYQVLLLGMIYAVFACVGEEFVCVWMGPDFRMAGICALLVMAPDILIFSEQVANTAAIAGNLVKQQAIGYILMAAVCVSVSLPLSSVYGATGAAAAIAVAYMFLFIYNNVLYYKKLQLNMWKFIKECYGRLMIPLTCTLVVGYYICNRWIQIGGWRGVILKSTVTILLYLLSVILTSTSQERTMIVHMLKERSRKGH